jgi:hypothetical protein
MRRLLMEQYPDVDYLVVMSPDGRLHDKNEILGAYLAYVK